MSRDLPLADVSSEVDFTVAIVGASGAASGTMTPTGFEQLTGLDFVQSLTVPADTTYAILSTDLAPVRWRADGVAPTASTGTLIPSSSSTTIYEPALSAVQVIEAAGAASLSVAYFR